MSRLRFGVVGCGAIVTLHQLPALRRCGQVEVVAVVDRDLDWATRVARRFDVASAFDDVAPLVGRVDAALVATPNTTHADIACRLLERGVHVLCEKPMATSRVELDRMIDAGARGGGRVMAAHCLRFSGQFAALARIVSEGWLGAPKEIRAGIGAPYDAGQQRTDFRRNRALAGGGALIDLGVHVLDLTAWLLGTTPIEVCSAMRSLEGWEVESDAEVALRYPDGVCARIDASFSQLLDNTFTVRGSGGFARASLYVPTELTVFSEQLRACRRAGMQTFVVPDVGMYDAQIAHFCEAVLAGAPFLVRDDEVRATLDVVERCYRTAP